MTREQVRKLVDRIGLRVLESDAHGIMMRRSGVVANRAPLGPDRWYRSWQGTYHEERWRLRCGSGIAGRGGEWTLVRLPDAGETLGPYTKMRDLEQALRQWRRWDIP